MQTIRKTFHAAALLLCATAATQVHGGSHFAEGFDSAAADVTIQADADTLVRFVDYANMTVGATTFGIPEAPRRIGGSAPTRGLLLAANLTAGVRAGINVLAGATPRTFSGTYTLSFDAYLSISVDPFPTSGSTECLLWGVGTDGVPPLEARRNRGTGTAGTFGWLNCDNGSSTDDAAIVAGDVTIAALGDSQPGQGAPFAAAFTVPIGTRNAPGNEWVRVDVEVGAGRVRVLFNGIVFFDEASAATSGHAMLGYEDAFASVLGYDPPPGQPDFPVEDYGWGLFDNFRVTLPCGFAARSDLLGTGNPHGTWDAAVLTTGAQPVAGSTARLLLDYAKPAPEPAALIVGSAAADPLATLPGYPIYVDLGLPHAVVPFATAAFSTILPIGIARDPALCNGMRYSLQAVIGDTDVPSGVAGPLPLVFSNRVDWTIGDRPPLVITEVMQNPSAAPDGTGEWFEVHNDSLESVDVNGWTVRDDGIDSFVVRGAPPIPPGAWYVFGVSGDPLVNGGVPVDHVYSGLFLGNGADELVLEDALGHEVDRIAWDDGATFPDPNGASMTLDPAQLEAGANDAGRNWRAATVPFGAGDLGTPGAPN